MRSARSYLAAGIICLGLFVLAPPEARAQVYISPYGGVYASSFYDPYYPFYSGLGYSSYYSPSLYTYPYYRPYRWSGRYFNNPFRSGLYYQRYYPWTNRYYYRYRLFR